MAATNGKSALFIHGAGGGGWEWRHWVPIFQDSGWTCMAPDLQPHPNGLSQTRFDDYLGQAIGWLSGLESGKIAVIGASMGGILGLKASETIRPDALILINSVGPAGIPNPASEASYPEIIPWSKGNYADTEAAMPDCDLESTQFAFAHWRDESGAVLAEISNGIPVSPVQCPILVVVGESDRDVLPVVGTEIASRFGAELRICPGMSHLGPLLGIQSTELAHEVLHWINAHSQ